MDKTSRTSTNEYLELNRMILDVAVRGKMECLGPVDISWNLIGKYVFVLVEEYTGKWWYRIFICRDEFCYEQNRLLDPKPGYDDLRYVYGYYEEISGEARELQHLENGNWMQKMKTKISGEIRALYEDA